MSRQKFDLFFILKNHVIVSRIKKLGYEFRSECKYCTDGKMICISCDGRGTRTDPMLRMTCRCRDCFGVGNLECMYC